MALGATLFALMNFFARVASSTASWASVGAVRALVGALVAVAVARARGASLAARDRRAVLLRSVFGTAAMIATFYSLSSRSLSLGDTVTLLNLAPVFLALLAPVVLRERTTLAVALALACSLAGVLMILRPGFVFGDGHAAVVASTGPSATVTAVAALSAALMSSLAMMMLRRMGQTETPESIAVHFSSFAAVTLGVLAAFDPRLPSLRDFGLMIAAGLCAGFAQLAMTRAYTLERAARVAGMSYLAVVASALLGAAALSEVPDALATIGMLLVVAGGVLLAVAREAPAPRTALAPAVSQAADVAADERRSAPGAGSLEP